MTAIKYSNKFVHLYYENDRMFRIRRSREEFPGSIEVRDKSVDVLVYVMLVLVVFNLTVKGVFVLRFRHSDDFIIILNY